MPQVNIEWINVRTNNTNLATNEKHSTLDIRPINNLDTSFEVIDTSTTSASSSAAPSAATHALVSSVSGVHFVRNGETPGTATGGVCITSGASRLILLSGGGGDILEVIATTD